MIPEKYAGSILISRKTTKARCLHEPGAYNAIRFIWCRAAAGGGSSFFFYFILSWCNCEWLTHGWWVYGWHRGYELFRWIILAEVAVGSVENRRIHSWKLRNSTWYLSTVEWDLNWKIFEQPVIFFLEKKIFSFNWTLIYFFDQLSNFVFD